ncbi:hypothetical protein JCM6882_001266 [Rhodosporidiobolus microsporus]
MSDRIVHSERDAKPLTPHDRFTIPHHPDEVPTVPPQALVALEQEITEGTARVEKAEENKPDLNKYYHYLVDLVEDIEHARATLFVYAALTHTQTISLLRQFVEAQEKIDKQFEQEQEDLFDGELSYACTRPIRAAVKYRHELLYDFLGQVARRGHKKYVLDARDCEVIAQMWGMPSPPVVAPGYWPSSSRGLKP